jgi:hypothetical protein
LDTYLVTASAQNLRSTAKLTGEVIGSFERGTVVERLDRSEDGLWMEVTKGSKTGWVFVKYLTKQGEEQTPVVEHEEFPWMSIAASEIGQKEVPGDGSSCIAVFSRGKGGHVAFYVGTQGLDYRVLGGNQADAVCVAGYPKARLLGFRVPR